MRTRRSKHQKSPQTKRMKRAKGGSMKKSFPDLSGDGKVTKKDVLMGRGVIRRPAKKSPPKPKRPKGRLK